jgi:hypothetical protein
MRKRVRGEEERVEREEREEGEFKDGWREEEREDRREGV